MLTSELEQFTKERPGLGVFFKAVPGGFLVTLCDGEMRHNATMPTLEEALHEAEERRLRWHKAHEPRRQRA